MVYTKCNERGIVAVVALIVMMVMGVMGTGLMVLGTIDAEIAANHRDGVAAQYVAEAGIQWALVKLKTNPAFVMQTVTQENITTYTIERLSNSSGICTVKTKPGPAVAHNNLRIITSTGVVNKAIRQVRVQVCLPSDKEDTKVIWDI